MLGSIGTLARGELWRISAGERVDARAATKSERSLGEVLFLPAVVLLLAMKCWLSWARYLNQDEFETLHQGWLLFSGAVQFRDFNSNHPPLAFQLLGCLNWITDDPAILVRLGRAATLASSLIAMALVFQIANSLYGKLAAQWAVILYGSSATFWEWSCEIRSDSLLTPLCLGALAVVVSPSAIEARWRLLATGALLGLAFWTNQKALFHAMPLGALLLCGGPKRQWSPWQSGWALLGAMLPTGAVIAMAVSNGSLPYLIEHNFLGAWRMTTSDPYAPYRELTIRQLLERDPGFVLASGSALLWGCSQWRKNSLADWFVLSAAIWMAGTLWLTPGPFPYYMLSVLPLFAVSGGRWLASLGLPLLLRGRWSTTCAAIVMYMAFPLARAASLHGAPCDLQLQTLRLGAALTDPGDAVFDGSGTLVNRPDAYAFHWILWTTELARYRAGLLPPLVAELKRRDCRLVLDTYRVRNLPEKDLDVLRRQFVPLWGPLRVPGFDSLQPLGSQPAQFDLWRGGEYEVLCDGATIDGRTRRANEIVSLAAGMHVVCVKGPARRVQLREARHRSRVQLPPEPADSAAFLGKFGYKF